MLVAVSFSLEASEAVAERRSSFQFKRWEAYARLHKKVNAIAIFVLLLHSNKSLVFCSIAIFVLLLYSNKSLVFCLTPTYFRYLKSGGVHLDTVIGQQILRGTHYARMEFSIRFVPLVFYHLVSLLFSSVFCFKLSENTRLAKKRERRDYYLRILHSF